MNTDRLTKREAIAVKAMQSIIADPSELPKERVACSKCSGRGFVELSVTRRVECVACGGTKLEEASCARSVAIKAVRYADELIAELGRTQT